MPAIMLMSDEPASSPPLTYYDDYLEVEPGTTASGSLEILTDSGHTYAHAKGLGDGTLTAGENVTTYSIAKAPLDVFLIMGQSNAAYSYYDVATASPVGSPGTTYYYGDSTKAMSTNTVTATGMHDAVKLDGSAVIGHIEMPFMTTYHELTGHKIYTINTGYNGAFISQLAPDGVYYSYEQTVADGGYAAIDLDYYVPNFVGYLWLQGESDAGYETQQVTYVANFLKLMKAINGTSTINRLSEDFTMSQAFVIQTKTTRSATTADALTYLCDNYTNVHMATDVTLGFTVENGLMRSDNLHYSQAGQNIIGEKVAQYIFKNRLY